MQVKNVGLILKPFHLEITDWSNAEIRCGQGNCLNWATYSHRFSWPYLYYRIFIFLKGCFKFFNVFTSPHRGCSKGRQIIYKISERKGSIPTQKLQDCLQRAVKSWWKGRLASRSALSQKSTSLQKINKLAKRKGKPLDFSDKCFFLTKDFFFGKSLKNSIHRKSWKCCTDICTDICSFFIWT